MTNFIQFHDCHPDEFVRVVDHHLLHSGPLRCCFCYAESHSHGVQPAYGVFGNCEGGPWRLGEFVNVPEEDVFFWPRTCATKQDGFNFWWLLYGKGFGKSLAVPRILVAQIPWPLPKWVIQHSWCYLDAWAARDVGTATKSWKAPTGVAGENGSKKKPSVLILSDLVSWGQFPSLGLCSCRKKDGMACSMPCDTDKTGGRLVLCPPSGSFGSWTPARLEQFGHRL